MWKQSFSFLSSRIQLNSWVVLKVIHLSTKNIINEQANSLLINFTSQTFLKAVEMSHFRMYTLDACSFWTSSGHSEAAVEDGSQY